MLDEKRAVEHAIEVLDKRAAGGLTEITLKPDASSEYDSSAFSNFKTYVCTANEEIQAE